MATLSGIYDKYNTMVIRMSSEDTPDALPSSEDGTADQFGTMCVTGASPTSGLPKGYTGAELDLEGEDKFMTPLRILQKAQKRPAIVDYTWEALSTRSLVQLKPSSHSEDARAVEEVELYYHAPGLDQQQAAMNEMAKQEKRERRVFRALDGEVQKRLDHHALRHRRTRSIDLSTLTIREASSQVETPEITPSKKENAFVRTMKRIGHFIMKIFRAIGRAFKRLFRGKTKSKPQPRPRLVRSHSVGTLPTVVNGIVERTIREREALADQRPIIAASQ